MCNLSVILLPKKECTLNFIEHVESSGRLMSHRGPDQFNLEIIDCDEKKLIMIHNRLKIVGNDHNQPIRNNENTINLIINGEIFNYHDLEKELNYTCKQSDCEILIPLYIKYIKEEQDYNKFFSKINGQYSFVMYDSSTEQLFVSRDHIGITPLYSGNCGNKLMFASELKFLVFEKCTDIKIFEPRKYALYSVNSGLKVVEDMYLEYKMNYNESNFMSNKYVMDNINEKLTNAVLKQVNGLNVEFGCLLSGGLDSSLITSIIQRNSKVPIKTFSIGITKDSVDIIAARKVADFLGTEHHEIYFNMDEVLNNISNVIYYIESYCLTSVRASIVNYLIIKKIKKMYPELKVLFGGGMSDECMNSYLYCGNAPTLKDFIEENLQLINNVHKFDSLRENKTAMANSIEMRIPFSDPDFVKFTNSLPPSYKIYGKLRPENTEKHYLRLAFSNDNYLPNEIIWRTKNAFSDGISTEKDLNMIDEIIKYCDNMYSNNMFLELSKKYSYNEPKTKEMLYYREIFHNLFNSNNNNNSEETVSFWKPKWTENDLEPSAVKNGSYK